MTCGLNDEELFVLNLLYTKRCLKRSGGFHRDKLTTLFCRRFESDVADTIKNLRNLGYLGAVGKSPPKYYIADIPRTFNALGNHGFNVSRGRVRRL